MIILKSGIIHQTRSSMSLFIIQMESASADEFLSEVSAVLHIYSPLAIQTYSKLFKSIPGNRIRQFIDYNLSATITTVASLPSKHPTVGEMTYSP